MACERRLPDGSKEIFGLPEPEATRNGRERRVFLTEIVDPAGNSLKLAYDSLMRITAVTDAIGQVTRVSYNLPSDLLKITRVTDPFGRSASFGYDAEGPAGENHRHRQPRLRVQLRRGFHQPHEDAIRHNHVPDWPIERPGRIPQGDPDEASRWLEATDPLGDTERIELRSRVPERKPVEHGALYWDKRAWKEGGRDYTKARIYQWMLYNGVLMSGVPWRLEPPLEGETVMRLGRDKDDILHNPATGTDGLPANVTRTLDDGAEEVRQYEYNGRGYVTRAVDPAGRSILYSYASNGMDLLEVFNAKTNERLALFTYNSQHLPLTITDGSGQTTKYTYNARGQVLWVTNPKGEATTYSYDEKGYLTQVTGPVAEAVFKFTYDGFGRLQTVTDPSGYR